MFQSKFLIVLLVGLVMSITFGSQKVWAGTVYYCEVIESVLIEQHKATRTKLVGKKFKMEVLVPKKLPGGGIKFSEGAPMKGEFEIIDSWEGVEKKFIAKELGKGNTALHFNKGYVTFVSIADLSNFDGPVWGITSSANCDRF